MQNIQHLEHQYLDQLRNLYSAQQQVYRAFPKLSRSVAGDHLQRLIEEHLEAIRTHAQRMESIAFGLGTHPSGRFCQAMEVMLQEAYRRLEQTPQTSENPLLLVVEQLARYTLEHYFEVLTLANQLGQERACELLQTSLEDVRQFALQIEQLRHQSNTVKA